MAPMHADRERFYIDNLSMSNESSTAAWDNRDARRVPGFPWSPGFP